MGYLCFNCGTRFRTKKSIDEHNCEDEINKRERGDSADDNRCQTCQKTFSKPFNLKRHRNNCRIRNETKRLHCKFCGKTFTSYTNRSIHEKKCSIDNAKVSDPSPSVPESSTPPEDDPSNKRVKCRKCGFKCGTASDLYAHRMHQHSQGESSLYQDPPWGSRDKPLWERDDGSVDDAMRLAYNQHRHLILKKKVTEQSAVTRYNFPASNNMSLEDFKRQIEEMYENSSNAFKINLSFGLMLRHIETGKYRYFTPYGNETLFDMPLLISCRSDVDKYMQKLSELDILNYMLRQRPDTGWKPVMVCNVVYSLFRTSFALGNSKRLPSFITKSTSIISLECNMNSGKPYEDNLCMFRCLAYHEIKNVKCLEKLTNDFSTRWLLYVEKQKIRNSEICIVNMAHVEKCFRININVFSLNKNRTCEQVYKSLGNFPNRTMYLNLHEKHLSYIKNFSCYASKYRCSLCDKMFPTAYRLNRHSKVCENKTKLKFPGGYYKHSKTIFDKLEEWNIFVAPEKRFYPWFGVFDLEAVLIPEEQTSDTGRKLLYSHKPICVCLCSNVPGFEKETFILKESKSELLREMCEYLTLVSCECEKLAQTRWNDVYSALNRLENEWCKEHETELASDSNSQINGDDILEREDGLNISEARDSDDYEPPSAEFLEKMSKENVWYKFMRDLSEKDSVDVSYNDWSENSSDGVDETPIPVSSQTGLDFQSRSRSCSSSSRNEDDDDDDDDDGDDDIDFHTVPVRVLNEESTLNGDGYSNSVKVSSNKRRLIESDDDDDVNDVNGEMNKFNRKKIRIDECDRTINSKLYPEVAKLMKKKVRLIKADFERYCGQLPVLGFNSGKYDINLIKSELAIQLGLHKSKGRKFVIKRNNNYTCISNSHLKFLDLCNYLPPGTSYDSFLVSFNVPIRKSFFPYEYLTDISKLDESSLPPPECFYSNLKNCNTLENKTFLQYSRLIEIENKSREEALKILKLDSVPISSIEENYAKLQNVWKERNMNSLRDFLQYYAELDVGPMVLGVSSYQDFFFKKGLDVFKDYISVPGIARKMLYECGLKNGASFSLFDKYDADLYETFMRNMTGGPSIIFTRRHVVGETLIRGDGEKRCRSIFGYDANSLYLHAICQNMPVGRYIRRKSVHNFRPENPVKRYYAMFQWMDWQSHITGKRINHNMNNGREFKIGPYYVDGKSDSNEVFDFLGCTWHGHGCKLCKSDDDRQEMKYNSTLKRLEFIKDQGFKIITIWECEYRKQLKENVEMRNFVNATLPSFFRKHRSSVTSEQIIEGVMSEELFGFVEVDIEIPDSWEQVKYKPDTDLSPYEYFKEMCPLFLTSEIPFDCIGKHMQDHVKKFNLSQKPRKLLVGGLRAECMIVMTPLLKWYISHGMYVKNIHQVVEFSKQACFKQFGSQVADARREGDIDPNKRVIALLFKLIGNSAFGGTIINKEKQKRHKFVEGFKSATLEVNNPRFTNMNEFENDIFEMEFKKARIAIDTPIILGIAILNYAKLHLLRFYYDFLDVFVGRNRFECIECDTDSLYFALSEESLAAAIKFEMKEKFRRSLMSNCDDNYAPEPGADDIWFPRECCDKHYKFDLKSPGLMKKEFEATRMTGLCSKSYVAKCETTGAVKYSLKGVNKCFVDPTENFERVLSSQSQGFGENRGIALHSNTMYSYNQIKRAFSYFYCKRKVCDDGVHTEPLDICLRPGERK